MFRAILFSFFYSVAVMAAKKTGDDHPTLPTLWTATTIDPPMGQGEEDYKFVSVPSPDNPSAMWSKYEGCQRLIYVTGTVQTRYLLGCDAVDCCTESQSGNQVEFQIPNVYYTNPSKKVQVNYQRTNVTNFGEVIEADEWSWDFEMGGQKLESLKAYTEDCEECVNGVRLLNWWVKAVGGPEVMIQFKGYKGFEPDSDEGQKFISTFEIPDVCQQGQIYECDDGLHDKHFGHKATPHTFWY